MKHVRDSGISYSAQRALLRGEFPDLVFEDRETCPLGAGDQVALAGFHESDVDDTLFGEVYVTVVSLHTTKDGKTKVEYRYSDNRDRYLEKYGVTTLKERSIDPEAPYEDPVFLKRYSTEARFKKAMSEQLDPKQLCKSINVRLKRFFDGERDESKWTALATEIEALIRRAENG